MTYCSIALLQKGKQRAAAEEKEEEEEVGARRRNKMVNSIFKRLYPLLYVCLSGPVVSRDPNDKLVSSPPYANLSLMIYTLPGPYKLH